GVLNKEKVVKTSTAKKIIKYTTSSKKDYGKEFIDAVFKVKELKKELKQEKEKNQILKTKIKGLEDENAKLKIERDYEEMENKSNKNNKSEKNEKIEINKALKQKSKKVLQKSI
ncbi:hypothetical protein, partial [Nautilia sp.]